MMLLAILALLAGAACAIGAWRDTRAARAPGARLYPIDQSSASYWRTTTIAPLPADLDADAINAFYREHIDQVRQWRQAGIWPGPG